MSTSAALVPQFVGFSCLTQDGESGLLKTNATEECLAYHTQNIKQTNMYGNRSVSSAVELVGVDVLVKFGAC